MNFAIDPDVLKASFVEEPCRLGISKIGSDFASHRFYRDKEGVLESEYRQIFAEKWETDKEHPAVLLLQRLLFDDGNDKDVISSKHDIVEELKKLGCSEPVEPDLLGMLANARNHGLILAMVGHDIDNLRKRGLHITTTCWQVRKKIPWLDVRWIGKSRVEIPESDYSDNQNCVLRAKQYAFEPKAALWLQDHDPLLRCITPPAKGKIGNEQIDVYGYRDKDDEMTVVIGECKLRREGNESKWISVEEVQQLRRKVIAARNYEEKRNPESDKTRSASTTVIAARNYEEKRNPKKYRSYEGILISNAEGIEDQAREFIKSEESFSIRILRLTIKKGWERCEELTIVRGEWLL